MKILVYPHTMEIGGSQLNAVELAGAVRDRGHEVVVFSEDGPLVDTVRSLGLPHVLRHDSLTTPDLGTSWHLRSIIAKRQIDIVHGYEWPPALEATAAVAGTRARVVATVLSMAVADFIPRSIPLVVGTQGILDRTRPTWRGPVHLIEPPIDTVANSPEHPADEFERAWPRAGVESQVVIVSRLANDVKLEGILTAVTAVGRLAATRSIRLVIVGDGLARSTVAAAAESVNTTTGLETVVLTGAMADPRGAYAAADVCVGMGGSALKAMSFAKPLVVQGEGGFFERLMPATAPTFLQQGWYGTARLTQDEAVARLAGLLGEILDEEDAEEDGAAGGFGRAIVEHRYSLAGAAVTLEQVYEEAQHFRDRPTRHVRELGRSGVGLVGYKVRRRRARARGTAPRPGVIEDTL